VVTLLVRVAPLSGGRWQQLLDINDTVSMVISFTDTRH
jgi:hypothetical protein